MPRTVVYLRFPQHRNGFKDPPAVEWDMRKESELWKMLRNGSTDFEWNHLAQHFGVPLVYILQQAAWLYEKELGSLRRRISLMSHSQIKPADFSNRNEELLMEASEPPPPLLLAKQRESIFQSKSHTSGFNEPFETENHNNSGYDALKDSGDLPTRRLLSSSRMLASDNDTDFSDSSMYGFIMPQTGSSSVKETHVSGTGHLSSIQAAEAATPSTILTSQLPGEPSLDKHNLNQSMDSVSSDSTVSQSAMEAALIAQDNRSVSESE